MFTFMAYSPPYSSVNGMMILFFAYKKNGFESKYIYIHVHLLYPIGKQLLFMAYLCRQHTFIFLFMTEYKGPLI